MVVRKLNCHSGFRKVENYDVRAVSGDTAFVPSFVKIEQHVPDFKRVSTSTNTHAYTDARAF